MNIRFEDKEIERFYVKGTADKFKTMPDMTQKDLFTVFTVIQYAQVSSDILGSPIISATQSKEHFLLALKMGWQLEIFIEENKTSSSATTVVVGLYTKGDNDET